MSIKPEEVEFCLKCKQQNPPDRPVCSCGGRNFVFGNNISLADNTVVCRCGSSEFELGVHIDYIHLGEYKYRCTHCGNIVGTQIYKGDEYEREY